MSSIQPANLRWKTRKKNYQPKSLAEEEERTAGAQGVVENEFRSNRNC